MDKFVSKKWLLAPAAWLAVGLVVLVVRLAPEREAASARDRADLIKLAKPRQDSNVSLERCLATRRSVRNYRDAPLSIAEAGQLLWAAQGITGAGFLRTAPSAGALYPLEVYVVAGSVDGLAPGIYKYSPDKHGLALVTAGDKRKELAAAALGQECVRNGAVTILFSAVYRRTMRKYGQRGVRYVHMEIGHAGQNVCLQATALGLGVVTVGAFDDAAVKRIAEMPEEEEPLYLLPVGRK